MTDPAERIGRFLRDAAPLWTAEKPVSFDPVQTCYLQGLVRESTLQGGVTVKKEEFFAAVVFIDWFTEVVAAGQTLVEDVKVLVEELEKIDEFLDPDLELLVRYAGLHAVKELKGPKLFAAASRGAIEKRHAKTNAAIDWTAATQGPLDPFHQAVGRMVRDQVKRDEARAALATFEGRNDLRAGLVADALLRAVPAAEAAPGLNLLAAGKPFEAALALLEALVKQSAGWSLKAHVDAIKGGLAARGGP